MAYINSLLSAKGNFPVDKKNLMIGPYEENLLKASSAIIEANPSFSKSRDYWNNNLIDDIIFYSYPRPPIHRLDEFNAAYKKGMEEAYYKKHPNTALEKDE